MRTIRIGDELPEEIHGLAAEARGEGHGNVERLILEWSSGEMRFGADGEALFAVFREGELAGVGGLTREPAAPEERVMRARRFYVARRFRGQGVAAALLDAVIQQAFEVADRITVNAHPASFGFWERAGFTPCSIRGVTHILPGA
jgi:GNAT superfamily N-acetyltransferase